MAIDLLLLTDALSHPNPKPQMERQREALQATERAAAEAAQAQAEQRRRELEVEEIKAREAARMAAAVEERQREEARRLQEQVGAAAVVGRVGSARTVCGDALFLTRIDLMDTNSWSGIARPRCVARGRSSSGRRWSKTSRPGGRWRRSGRRRCVRCLLGGAACCW